MREIILDLYNLTKKEFRKLKKEMTPEEMLKLRTHFIVNKLSIPVGVWQLFYYIDKYGDFINNGKRKHHKIARAVYNCLSAKEKLEILEYIDENCEAG